MFISLPTGVPIDYPTRASAKMASSPPVKPATDTNHKNGCGAEKFYKPPGYLFGRVIIHLFFMVVR
jgi:hypothetical protein